MYYAMLPILVHIKLIIHEANARLWLLSASKLRSYTYLSAELHQQLGCIRTVGSQAAHSGAEVSQTGDGFARLRSSAGSLCLTRA